MGGGQRERAIFRQRKYGLHQTLAEGGFTGDQAAVVVLDGAADNFRRRGGAAIHQHYQGIIFAAIAFSGAIELFR